MNLLFYTQASNSPLFGGVQRVSILLAKQFVQKGWNVYSLSTSVDGEFCYTDCFSLPEPDIKSEKNVEFLRSLVDSLKIDAIIVTLITHPIALYTIRNLNRKVVVISHFHFSPKGIYSSVFRYRDRWFSKSRLFHFLAFQYNRIKLQPLFKEVDSVSDRIVLLDRHFVKEIKQFHHFSKDKLAVINNPLTYPQQPFNVEGKEKIVLWVGRISEEEKRISSLLNIWRLASPRMPDWKLIIVGGGNELDYWKSKAVSMGLCRYEFVGRTDPGSYYESASIYTLTSNTEAWPMCLLEAMSRSCSPILFNSFESAKSIINNKECGVLVNPFNDREFARELIKLSENDKLRRKIAYNANNRCSNFSIEEIVKRWESLLKSRICSSN